MVFATLLFLFFEYNEVALRNEVMKMIRRVIEIDQEKCNGCALCVDACHEGAIVMNEDNKAIVAREDYCDGLGDCLPVCPTGAITFVTKETQAYDEEAVKVHLAERAKAQSKEEPKHAGCPGTRAKMFAHREEAAPVYTVPHQPKSQLRQWPIQIKLVSPMASFFQGANLLVAADCTAFAYANIHQEFMKNHVTIIGCPKLDMTDYAMKLTEILTYNDIKKVTVLRMEVPCCGGIEHAVKTALQQSGKMIPWQVYTVTCDGNIIE